MQKQLVVLKRLLFAITIFAGGCLNLPDEVIMPEWDVDLNVPLVNKLYDLDDIIGKQNYISISPTDSLYVVASDTFSQTKEIVDFIKMDQAFSKDNQLISPANGSSEVFIEYRSDLVSLDSARFQEGFIKLAIRNTTSVPVFFQAEIPGILLSDGNTLKLSTSLNPGASTVLDRQLAGAKYRIPPEQLILPELFRNQFWVKISTSTTGSPAPSERISYDVSISDFYFSSVSGKFPMIDIGRKENTFDLEIGSEIKDYRDKFKLKSATLVLQTEFATQFASPATLILDSLVIKATRNGETIYLMDNTGNRYLHLELQGSNTITTFNENNSNIEQFISFIPEKVDITASYKMDGHSQSGTITNKDLIKFKTNFSTRSQVAIQKTNYTDTVEVDIPEDNRTTIRDGRFASATVEINNALPLNTWFKIIVADINKRPLFTLKNTGGMDEFYFPGANVDATGKVTAPVFTTQTVELDSTQINKIADAYFAFVYINAESSGWNAANPPLVIIKASDWMKIKVFGKVKYHIHDDKD